MLESARLAGEAGDQVGVVRAYTNLAVSATWYGCEPIEAAAGWADAGLAIASRMGCCRRRRGSPPSERPPVSRRVRTRRSRPSSSVLERALMGAGPVPHVSLALQIGRAERHLSEAALDEAVNGFAAALQQADDLGHPGSSWLVRDGLARARLAAGDAPGAGAALAPAMAALRAQPALLRSFAWLATSAVEVAAALGDDEAAEVAGWRGGRRPARSRATPARWRTRPGRAARAGEVEGAARAMEEAGRRATAARIRLRSQDPRPGERRGPDGRPRRRGPSRPSGPSAGMAGAGPPRSCSSASGAPCRCRARGLARRPDPRGRQVLWAGHTIASLFPERFRDRPGCSDGPRRQAPAGPAGDRVSALDELALARVYDLAQPLAADTPAPSPPRSVPHGHASSTRGRGASGWELGSQRAPVPRGPHGDAHHALCHFSPAGKLHGGLDLATACEGGRFAGTASDRRPDRLPRRAGRSEALGIRGLEPAQPITADDLELTCRLTGRRGA